jgi:hypothetical protein
MEFQLRRVHDHADVKIKDGSTTIDFGFLDRKDATELLEQFKDAVDDLEWFIKATDKGE